MVEISLSIKALSNAMDARILAFSACLIEDISNNISIRVHDDLGSISQDSLCWLAEQDTLVINEIVGHRSKNYRKEAHSPYDAILKFNNWLRSVASYDLESVVVWCDIDLSIFKTFYKRNNSNYPFSPNSSRDFNTLQVFSKKLKWELPEDEETYSLLSDAIEHARAVKILTTYWKSDNTKIE